MSGRQNAPHQCPAPSWAASKTDQLREAESCRPKKFGMCLGLGFRRDDEVAGSEKKDEITFRRFWQDLSWNELWFMHGLEGPGL